MRGPDSEPYEVASDDWQDWDEYTRTRREVAEVPCPCCKGEGHGPLTPCEQGLDLALREAWHPVMNTPLPEWPGCWVCFDAGVVPCDERTEEVL
jgi:hypothetical protein